MLMAQKLNRGATVLCPLCGKPQEDKVEDFVVPGRIGATSEQEHECIECEACFTVICTGVDQYNVLPI